jgi:hypothetical protein
MLGLGTVADGGLALTWTTTTLEYQLPQAAVPGGEGKKFQGHPVVPILQVSSAPA